MKLLIIILALLPLHAIAQNERLLYVAHDQGLIYVYDIGDGHKLLRKFEVPGTGEFKGIAADPIRGKLYLSSYVGDQLVCVDLKSEKVE